MQTETAQSDQQIVIVGTRGSSRREQVVADPSRIPSLKTHLWNLGYSVKVIERHA